MLIAPLLYLAGCSEFDHNSYNYPRQKKAEVKPIFNERIEEKENLSIAVSDKSQYAMDCLSLKNVPDCFSSRNSTISSSKEISLPQKGDKFYGDFYGRGDIFVGSLTRNNKGENVFVEIEARNLQNREGHLFLTDNYTVTSNNSLYVMHLVAKGNHGLYQVKVNFKKRDSDEPINSTGFYLCLNK